MIDPQLDPFGPEDSPDRLKGRILLLHKNTTVEQLAKQEATAPAAQSLVINTEAIKSPLTAGDKVAGGNLSPSATVQGKSPVSLLGRLSSFSLSPTRSNDGNDTPRSFVTVSSNTQTALITQEEMSSDLFKLFALSSKHVGDKQKLENAELRDGTVLSFTEETMLTAGASKELTLYNHTNLR